MLIHSRRVKFFLLIVSLLLTSCDEGWESPYFYYSSLLNQSGSNPPVETVLFNDFELVSKWGYENPIVISWVRENIGVFKGTLSTPLDANSTLVVIQLQEEDRILTGGLVDSKTIRINSCDRFNPYDTRDGMTNAVLEIKVFKK